MVKLMDGIEFKSLQELYDRVKPALYSKLNEIKALGFNMVSEVDIWNYLVENSWKKRTNLELSDIISDILYANNSDINDYVMDKITKYKGKDEAIMQDDSLI